MLTSEQRRSQILKLFDKCISEGRNIKDLQEILRIAKIRDDNIEYELLSDDLKKINNKAIGGIDAFLWRSNKVEYIVNVYRYSKQAFNEPDFMYLLVERIAFLTDEELEAEFEKERESETLREKQKMEASEELRDYYKGRDLMYRLPAEYFRAMTSGEKQLTEEEKRQIKTYLEGGRKKR